MEDRLDKLESLIATLEDYTDPKLIETLEIILEEFKMLRRRTDEQ